MIITVRYSHVRGPKTIIEQVRRGNAERREHEGFSGAKDVADALNWIFREGVKKKGFVYQSMEAIDTEHMPKTIRTPGDEGGTDADIFLGPHRRI